MTRPVARAFGASRWPRGSRSAASGTGPAGAAMLLVASLGACSPADRTEAPNVECDHGQCHCAPSFADCDGTRTNGCEASLLEEYSCGECGRDCLDGQCNRGRCSWFRLSTPSAAASLAADDSHVYYCHPKERQIWRLLQSGGVPELILSEQGCGAKFAVAREQVYWVVSPVGPGNDSDTLFRSAATGGAPEEIAVAPIIETLVGKGDVAVWVERRASEQQRAVVASFAGSEQPVVVHETGADATIGDVDVEGGDVYWSELQRQDGTVVSRLLRWTEGAGEPVEIHAVTGYRLLDIHVVGEHVYWRAEDDYTDEHEPAVRHQVARLGLDGGEPTVLREGNDDLSSLRADQTGAYWTEGGRSELYRSRPDEPAPQRLAELLRIELVTLATGIVVWYDPQLGLLALAQ